MEQTHAATTPLNPLQSAEQPSPGEELARLHARLAAVERERDHLAAIVDILHRAGLPKGVLNLIMGKGSVVGQVMLDSPEVTAITFTGSQATGKRVAEASIQHMRKFQLEMGGKNPLVVLDDADLAVAAECAVNGAFFSTGAVVASSSPSSAAAESSALGAAGASSAQNQAPFGQSPLFAGEVWADATAGRVSRTAAESSVTGRRIDAAPYQLRALSVATQVPRARPVCSFRERQDCIRKTLHTNG